MLWGSQGDIQVLHNHQIVHARSEFTDWPGNASHCYQPCIPPLAEPLLVPRVAERRLPPDDVGRKRHLLRLWITPPNARPLPAAFAERYGSVDVACVETQTPVSTGRAITASLPTIRDFALRCICADPEAPAAVRGGGSGARGSR